MRNKLMPYLAAMFLVVLSGCYSERFYDGDGELGDNGFLFMMGGRYELDLGRISLTESKVYKYRLEDLPTGSDFTVGFNINEHVEVVQTVRTVIRVQLFNDKAESVVDVQAELKDWTHSYALSEKNPVYAYMRGKGEIERRFRENSPIYTGADCGHGTYFCPRWSAGYNLIVTIQAVADSPIEEIELLLHSS